MKSQRNTSCNNMVSKLDTRLSNNAAMWRRKPLVSAVLAGMVATLLPLSVSHTVSASELDVYEVGGAESPSSPPPEGQGGPKMMIMLSTNSTMGCTSIGFDYPHLGFLQPMGKKGVKLPKNTPEENILYYSSSCEKVNEKPKTITVGGKTLTYTEYSYTDENGNVYLSRKDRAISGLLEILNNPDTLPKNTSLGLSFYGFDQGQADSFFNTDHKYDARLYHKNLRDQKAKEGKFYQEGGADTTAATPVGLIKIPITPLQKPDGTYDQAFINSLKEAVIKMAPKSNLSPVGSGYAEALSYLLGSTTLDRDNKFTSDNKQTYPIRYSIYAKEFQLCLEFDYNGNCRDFADSWVPLVSPWKEQYMDLLDKGSDNKPVKILGKERGYPGNQANNIYYQYTTIVSSGSEKNRATPSGIEFAKSTSGLVENGSSLKTIAYNSPMEFDKKNTNTQNNQCSAIEEESTGNFGFYFLTDGLPGAGDVGIGDERDYFVERQMKNLFKNSIEDPQDDFSCFSNDQKFQGLNDIREVLFGSEDSSYSSLGRSGWNCILAASQKLHDKKNKYKPIRTAIAGYGIVYANGFTGSYKKIEDCSSYKTTPIDIKKQDAYLACQWGQEEYGKGGFYVVNDGAGLAKSIKNFATSLDTDVNTVTKEYSAQQGDGLTVAADVTDATTSSNFAFLPLMLPRPGSKQLLWAGNVNKYKVKNGSLFDKNDKHIYDKVSGQIEPDTTELWNKSGSPDGGAVRTMVVKEKTYEPAGAYAQLTAPDSSKKDSIRTVYVEKGSGGIQKVEIKSNKPDGFDTLGYDFQKQQYLLNFLGYKVPVFANKKRITVDDYDGKDATSGEKNGVFKDKTNPMKDISDYAPAATDAIKILGGINNSKPQEVLYEKIYDTSTKNTTQTSAVLYGSTDGALHLVDGATGAEYFAFIPKGVMTSDRNIAAFKEDSTTLADGKDNETGKIAYGVDAPWYVDVLLNRKYETSKVTYTTDAIIKDGPVGHVRAYGGLGRGGIGFYGLNIKNKTSPEWLFGFDNTKSGFERLGNTWSKPTKSKIQFKEGAKTVNKEVLFLTGGYDLCYDNSDFKLGSSNTEWKTKVDQKGDSCDSKSEALGNAVYMIDATNGDLLWTAKLEGTTPSTTELKDKTASKSTGNPYLKYSIPGEAAVIDTNYDGYVDSIYFADLGGQVFRADFAGEYTKDTGIKSKVTRILDTNDPNKADNVSLRLFQRPVVSAYRFDITKEKNKITDITTNSRGVKQTLIVSVASGDRNTPLSTLPERKASKNPNKIISVWNADKIEDTKTSEGVARLYKTGSGSDLLKLNFSSTSEEQLANKEKLIDGKIVKGWYDNLIYFKGETVQDEATKPRIQPRKDKEGNVLKDVIGENVSYLRSFGQPVIKGGRLFVSVYNNQVYMPAPEGTCSPVPTGVTEAHEYCLPFGTCEKNNSNGRGSIHTLGPGVASANFADIDHGSSQFALVTTTEIKKSGGGVTSGGTGGSKLVEDKGVFASLYDLLPNRWFERLPLLTGKSSDSTSSK